MKRAMTILLVMAGLLTFIPGSISMVQAQTDPEFQAFLARLNGSRWKNLPAARLPAWYPVDIYCELNGDILTFGIHSDYTGIDSKGGSVKLENRRFTITDPNLRSVGEISGDGQVIYLAYTWSNLEYFQKHIGETYQLIKVR